MYVADVLNQSLPFRHELHYVVWNFQREDGGIRSHYLGNLTSDRGANSETARLILIAYNYQAEKQKASVEAEARVQSEREYTLRVSLLATIVTASVLALTASAIKKKGETSRLQT